MYIVDSKGKEHNLQFAVENWWIGDIGSFHSEKPSRLYIEAIENSIILQCKKEDQINLFVKYPKFNHIFRVLAENAMVSMQNRIMLNISSTAEERYLDFVQRQPHFFNRISNVQIASYLGVTPEFLSAIRKKIAESYDTLRLFLKIPYRHIPFTFHTFVMVLNLKTLHYGKEDNCGYRCNRTTR